jgi:capsid protein
VRIGEQLASFPTVRAAATWALGKLRKMLGYHEGGQRWSKDRSNLPTVYGSPRDTYQDDPPMERAVCIEKARYWERNSALVSRLIDVFEQYTVGANGMPIIPASSDADFNRAASVNFKRWSQFPDLSSRQSFSCLQSLIARRWFVDGVVYIYKTRGEPDMRGRVFPRIQIIETQNIATPPEKYEQEGKTIFEGVEVDGRKRPIAYYIFQSDGTFKKVKADSMIIVGEPTRVGQYHPFPFLSPVLNLVHDLSDLHMLEMLAAKDGAESSKVIKTETGEAKSDDDLIREGTTVETQNSAGADVEEERTKTYQRIFGGRTVFLKTGEEMEQFHSNRPSEAVQRYWDYLISEICIGVGIPKILAFPTSMQGTVVRADLDVANTFFQSRSAVLQFAFAEIYRYVTKESTWSDIALADPPADWFECRIRAPRGCNVDIGHQASAAVTLLEAGLMSYSFFLEPLGLDEDEHFEALARGQAKLEAAAKKYNVKPESLKMRLTEVTKALLEEQKKKAEAEDSELATA